MKCLILNGPRYKDAFNLASISSFAHKQSWACTAKDVKEADLILFTGGADVNPEMYGEEVHPNCSMDKDRDKNEATIFDMCIKAGKPMIGICRGAQFLTVMSGGKLIQHVGNHARQGTHKMIALDRELLSRGLENNAIKTIDVNSTHHQMMYPFNLNKNDYDLIGYAKEVSSKYEGVPQVEDGLKRMTKSPMAPYHIIEPEVVFYKNTRCLCVQYHPETMKADSCATEYFNKMVLDYLLRPYLFGKTKSGG